MNWIAKNENGEYVQHYNPIGHTMTFTADDRQAFRTTDPNQAQLWCTIAAKIYGRTNSQTVMQVRIA